MTTDIQFRSPTPPDGVLVHDLIARCPPLDTNSLYCNVLQCAHFADTSLIAERNGALVGFVSGYIPPDRSEAMFIWQIAVAPECRRRGLGVAMLRKLLQGDKGRAVECLETSITRTNCASWQSFRALARSLATDLVVEAWLSIHEHFASRHESEYLVRIGPIHREKNRRTDEETHS